MRFRTSAGRSTPGALFSLVGFDLPPRSHAPSIFRMGRITENGSGERWLTFSKTRFIVRFVVEQAVQTATNEGGYCEACEQASTMKYINIGV